MKSFLLLTSSSTLQRSVSRGSSRVFSRYFHKDNAIAFKKPAFNAHASYNSQQLMELEEHHVTQVYHPIPVVFDRAQGIHVWDPEGKHYVDFLSAYSAVNQGHSHPKILNALVNQAKRLSLSSRAFYNSVFPRFACYLTELFGYERMNPMNSGAEAVETALKIARKWGYVKKGIPDGDAIVVTCEQNFHGRTLAIISTSSDVKSKHGFGPYLPGYVKIPYNDVKAFQEILQIYGKKVCAFLVEPIQGEAGIIIPDDNYLKKCYDLCREHNVLFLGDEIQTGLGRTGRMLCCDWEHVRPDILILGKALSGGLLPLSCVLADNSIMEVMEVGSHGSTYGGNPLACAVGLAALEVIVEEDLAGNSERQGKKLLQALQGLKNKYPYVSKVRGRGLLCAIEMNPNYSKSAWDLCLVYKDRGLLAKPTHDHVIRLAPPLVISDKELEDSIKILDEGLKVIGC